jgi:quercetin dioxygenase-like cupin family protein
MPSLKIWDGINGPIAHSDKLLFGYFHIDAEAVLPVHQHPHEQWSHLIEGEFEFNVDGDIHLMKPGMSVYIPSEAPHSGKAMTKCLFLDCFYPVREDFVERERLAANT